MRILVTGSRRLDDYRLVYSTLNQVVREFGLYVRPDEYGNKPPDPHRMTVVVGDCPSGADLYAREWCWGSFLEPQTFQARWGTEGKAAGPLRNQRMIDSGVDLVLAFFKGSSRGTADCVRRAKKAGIPVREFVQP